jgi:trehalose-phosphatase
LDSRSGGIRPIYIGDDTTDEDAFRAIEQRGIGILVSDQSQPTAASYSLRDPAEVERFLRALAAPLRAPEL